MYHREIKPKKGLGQHFLKDLTVAERIAGTLVGYSELPILEVGPGTGVLTQFLPIEQTTVVELDTESVAYLRAHYPLLKERIIEDDFLAMDLDKLFAGQFCVIGNFPYNISSQIFFKVLEHRDKIPCCAGMLQKEVAERLAAKPGRKAYGIITVLLNVWYDIEYLFTVEPEVFDPPPKVRSGVIRMTRNARTALPCDEVLFKTVVKTAFNQRRKTMRNSLQSLVGKGNELSEQPIFDKRPEQLSVEEFIDLTNQITMLE
ncbi:16S rRNA (adenine(1518)-N(6)/adenine(1519)-N(6))-dimethyltransferase RsmA [Candidatus Symbiothrix dinenymphae]|uniref:16S rRNA (adenine(1518)-N(6)/adenine(1519)-N(6))- dimethyltransferase RsmA n=1 Tax=Candidatus Symbiothrix dinenymphae TaxID=467085 RepID=UPI0006BEE616|nr:16S rRNA (adenine(1518)-N(6)/adenine(1519)-N(6))-dimethyltransferase RsmA [Candidatus Symbiothrix dinenymphae]GAP72904.1 ribosomal RNA small subunit methyltransferasea [Candidatus Symbiothrix dinenymphae]